MIKHRNRVVLLVDRTLVQPPLGFLAPDRFARRALAVEGSASRWLAFAGFPKVRGFKHRVGFVFLRLNDLVQNDRAVTHRPKVMTVDVALPKPDRFMVRVIVASLAAFFSIGYRRVIATLPGAMTGDRIGFS